MHQGSTQSAPAETVLRLRVGRGLGYAIYGDDDGQPVFLFHGWPGSRLVGASLHDAARAGGVRLIAPDRPGMGHSDFAPKRTLLDWPRDVAELADALAVDRFAVLGYSAGAAYALACAHALADRVRAVTLVSPMAPANDRAARAALTITMRATFAAARRSSRLVEPMLAALAAAVNGLPGAFARGVLSLGLTGPSPLARPEQFEAYRRDVAEAFRAGPRGVAHDTAINARPWGFRPDDIEQPVHLFHGEADTNVPTELGRVLAQRIPDCHARFIPGAGHFWLFDHFPEVAATLSTPPGDPG